MGVQVVAGQVQCFLGWLHRKRKVESRGYVGVKSVQQLLVLFHPAFPCVQVQGSWRTCQVWEGVGNHES